MYRYRAWDGTQSIEPLAPERVLSSLTDALLSGSIEQALDRAIHRGLTTDDGEQLAGLDALRDQLRAEQRALDQQITGDQQLRDLTDALKAGAAGGATQLDTESSRLLESLASNPSGVELLLERLDREARSALQAALNQACGSGSAPEGIDLTPSETYSGSLDSALNRLTALDDLESSLRRVRHVADVSEIDPQLVRELLGDQAADSWDKLAASLAAFAGSGYLRGPEGRVELSARALQIIGDELLAAALQRVTLHQGGDRSLNTLGQHELTGATRDYQFGDPLALDLSRTVLHAVRRGGGLPVRLDARDFAIFEREDTARAATVLAIDLSRSMGERGYLLAARKLAFALTTLIRTRFPRDRVLLVGFSESARTVEARDLPGLTWDRFGFGTNVQDALRLSRNLLGAHRGMQRNLILLTDGEPTAYRDPGGTVRFSHPPTTETIAATLAEGERLRRDGIQSCVCVLSNELQVVRFAEQLCARAAGDLIVTAPDDLAAAVMLHYGQRRWSR
jgi:uncharacterized protein with von Willebrand factor type A (vWA) domain